MMNILEFFGEMMVWALILAHHIFKFMIIAGLGCNVIYIISKIKRNRTRKKFYGSHKYCYKYYNPKYRQGQGGRYSYVRMDKSPQKNLKQRIL